MKRLSSLHTKQQKPQQMKRLKKNSTFVQPHAQATTTEIKPKSQPKQQHLTTNHSVSVISAAVAPAAPRDPEKQLDEILKVPLMTTKQKYSKTFHILSSHQQSTGVVAPKQLATV